MWCDDDQCRRGSKNKFKYVASRGCGGLKLMSFHGWEENDRANWAKDSGEPLYQIVSYWKRKSSYFFFPLFPGWTQKVFCCPLEGGRVISLKFSHSGFEVAFMKRLTDIFPEVSPPLLGQLGFSPSKESEQVFIWPQQQGRPGYNIVITM